jgi:hypothetical protein
MLEEPQPEQNGQNYDLKASTKRIGQLYPMLKAADGEVFDGVHRIESDWKALVLENINTPEDKIIARLVANFHRRTVATEEKGAWINQLAEIYRNNGLRVEGTREKAQGPNEVARKICKVTGIAYRTVMEYLEPTFKQLVRSNRDPEQHIYRSDPEGTIFSHLKYQPTWGRAVIERFKEKIEKDLLQSPAFRKKVFDMLPKEQKNAILRATPTCLYRHREKTDPHEGYQALPDLYEIFMKECPHCLCENCDHADTCIERVRKEENLAVSGKW